MPVIKPFRALRYNPDKISFISRVVTPPYDVIDAETEKLLHDKDPHNFVRLGLGKTPQGGRRADEYLFVSDILQKWQNDGVLLRESAPSLYVLEQSFRTGELTCRRRGFIGALLLEENGGVHAHENIMDGPKADRIQLMEACRASLSQPMMMHSDPEAEINSIVESVCDTTDFVYSFRDENNIGHTLWRIDDPDMVESLTSLMENQSAVIADGHHRYQSALAFAGAHRPLDAPKGTEPEDYIPAFMVSVKDQGLLSLATHRGVSAGDGFDPQRFLTALEDYFSVKSFQIEDGDSVYREYNRLREDRPLIGCVLKNGTLLTLETKDTENPPVKNAGNSAEMERLPVAVLHYYIFPALLGIEPGSAAESGMIEYSSSAAGIYWGVQSGAFDLGFLLPPIPPALVQKIAEQGERLPIKSTFFYPKIPSGLLIYSHTD